MSLHFFSRRGKLPVQGLARYTHRSRRRGLHPHLDELELRVALDGDTGTGDPPTNRPPVAMDDTFGLVEDQSLVVPVPGVLANDGDPDGDFLQAQLVTSPTYGTLIFNAFGSFRYTPAADFHGTDQFTYRAFDGTLTSEIATVTLVVSPVNDAPVAFDDSFTVNSGTVLSLTPSDLLANDQDVDGDPLSVVVVSGPTQGTLTWNPDGSFSYTPSPGFSGNDQFVYSAHDGELQSLPAVVTIEVVPGESVPVLTTSGSDIDGVPGQPRRLHVAVEGTTGAVLVRVDWGDGTVEDAEIDQNGTVVHTFLEASDYHVRVVPILNESMLGDLAEHRITVTHAQLQEDPLTPGATVLALGGTTGNDVIWVSRGLFSSTVTSTLNGALVAAVPAADFQRLVVYGQEGDDVIAVSSLVSTRAWLFGGEGNDVLKAGGGSSLLLGGGGNDVLVGGLGNDILIGGAGSDLILALGGENLAIGGSTIHDHHDEALAAIQAEWTSGRSLAERRQNLLDGTGSLDALNGVYFLDAGSILDTEWDGLLAVGRFWWLDDNES